MYIIAIFKRKTLCKSFIKFQPCVLFALIHIFIQRGTQIYPQTFYLYKSTVLSTFAQALLLQQLYIIKKGLKWKLKSHKKN